MSLSWLPFTFSFSFQNLTPPLSIQRRFISFLLRRSLGHLLKPGQLDINQIDAQIGSGFVEVKDLELDCNAINSLLGSQPVQLQSGTIATVTARIPWPNPFSSTVGLSLSGLRLHFHVAESIDLSQDTSHADELAESVASVAETFIHDELTEKEEAQLRQSIHEGQGAFDDIPGSMSSFLCQDEEVPQKRTNDPEGVSIFAGLFESLLARFDFDASDSKISLTHDSVTLTLSIGRIHYFTTESLSQGQSPESKMPGMGEKRSVQVSEVKVAMQDQTSAIPRPSSPEGVPSRRPTESSTTAHDNSDSELDDEAQTMMSESLAFLPPRRMDEKVSHPPLSLSTMSSASAASSMYESAMSAAGSLQVHKPSTVIDQTVQSRVPETIILSISEPVTFQLTTPAVIARELNTDPEGSPIPGNKGKNREQPSNNVKLDISTGVVAVLLDARCVHGLLCLTDAFTSVCRRRPNHVSARSDGSETSILNHIDMSLQLQGLVALILGSTQDGSQDESSLSRFYDRPLVPPSFAGGYVRLHIDLIKMELRNDASTEHTPSIPFQRSPASSPPLLRSSTSHTSLVSCTISDFALLVYHSFTSSLVNGGSNVKTNSFSPLLITDRHLDSSYHSSIRVGVRADRHVHPYSNDEKGMPLPDVDVTDWYSEHSRTYGASLRPWRARFTTVNHRRGTSGALGAGFVSSVGIPSSPARTMKSPLGFDVPSARTRESSAFSLQLWLGRNSNTTSVTVETTALHLFLNLESVRSISEFVDAALPDSSFVRTEPPSPTSSRDHGMEDEDDYRPLSPRTVGEEKRRLEKLILEDLDLDMDYLQSGDVTPKRRASPPRVKPKRRKIKSRVPLRVDVLVPLVRVEIRVPPPQNRHPRTGSLVLDLHSAHFSSSNPQDDVRVPRFDTSNEDKTGVEGWFNDGSHSLPTSLEVRRVVVAYAAPGQLTAKTVLSLGPITDSELKATQEGNTLSHLLPLILFRRSESEVKPTALLARIPSLHAAVNKISLDGLQLWVDDLTQWIERLTGGRASGSNTGTQVSRASSLIGSRYFIQRSGSGSTDSEMACVARPDEARSEVVVKLCLSEAFIRFVVPMGEGGTLSANRFLDVCMSDLDALVEVKPEGKDETVISLNVLAVNVKESSTAGSQDVIISRPLSIDRKRSAVFRLRFRSVSLLGTAAKESRVRMILNGLTINMWSDVAWIKDICSFVRAPPGAFDSVIPSERTQLSVTVLECALRLTPPSRPSACVLSLGDITVSTDLLGESQETALSASVLDLSFLLNEDSMALADASGLGRETDAGHWMGQGYALLATVQGLTLRLKHNGKAAPANTQVAIEGMLLNVHLCADTIAGIVGFVTDLQTLIPVSTEPTSVTLPRKPTQVSKSGSSTLLRSVDEQAFRRQPVIGPLPDMVNDDLPRNPEYLDASFGAAAGLRVLDDEDEDDFHPEEPDATLHSSNDIISRHGGETIKMLCSPIEIVENFFDALTPTSLDFASEHGETSIRVRAQDCDVHLLLYDGYDWGRTKKAIHEEVKRVRRRLAKIRQLLASGQTYDPNVDEINSVLFNSVYVGLEQDAEELDGDALMAAIDDELSADASDMASESSWQSFKPDRRRNTGTSKTTYLANKLDRARGSSIEFSLHGMAVEFDQYRPGGSLASRFMSTVRDLEILDHVKTSTWSTFLTELRSDSRGNIRETDSNMVRVELQTLQPFQGHHEQEARLKAKILPLRLHVDQDALDFLKKFFSFKDSDAVPSPPPENEIFFQHVEIFPIDIKLDYKPRRVDYKALKEGRTIELMNFFHFDGSEMTLRHITLKGVTGWPRMFDTLNDLWTPDVKANQLVDVISGVSPIRSAVNVGSGIADLVLLPIAQYKKDGRIIRGLQKGATAFVKSTAMEAIRLGTRLATGTQVVLEQTENVLGAQFSGPVTAEALQAPGVADLPGRQSGDEGASAEDLYSRYAEQPTNIKEGVQSAYRSLSDNMKYAGQTILAVPMEVYERSGNEGPARAVIRAVPIAVLKPMIGASEAISKTLMGLHNTLDPQAQIETETKYKHR